MESAFAPHFAEKNEPRRAAGTAPGIASAAAKREPGYSKARERIEEIEQLYGAGLSTYDIAEELKLRPRDVGRNLREIRKRHERAARRQTVILAVGQCAAIQREAMEGWRRSQESKKTVTTRKKSGEPDTVTTRTQDGPGNASFLNTALRAMKQLRQIAGNAPVAPRKASDAAQLALMQILTPEQFQSLAPEQVENFRASFSRMKRVLREANAPAEADSQAADAKAADDTLQPSPSVEPAINEAPAAEPLPQANAELRAEPAFAANEEVVPEQASDQPAEPAVKQDADFLEASPIASNGHHTTTKKTPSEPRHPEWPAESFLSRSWLPPDPNFARNGRENGVVSAELPGQQLQMSP